MRNQDNWPLYYEKTSSKPPRETLLNALALFEKEGKTGKAFDLGSGACNDVAYLLQQNWEVVAVDNEEYAQKVFQQKLGKEPKASFQLASFEQIKWENVEFIHAGFALAFCPKEHFPTVMHAIKSHLVKGGRFAGNFFGPNHSWSHLCLVSKQEIVEIFKDFEIEWIEESHTQRTSTLGEALEHHNISVIARKN